MTPSRTRQPPRSLSLLRSPLLLLLLLHAASGCDNPYAPQLDEAAIEKNEQALAALNNECDEDADCMVTGCHRSICRAAPDGSFCDHTLRFTRLDADADREQLERDLDALLRDMLGADEVHTLRVSVEDTIATAWFHTTFTRREAIEQRLSAIVSGGIHRWAPDSQAIAQAALSALSASPDPAARARVTLRAAEGGPALLEAPIISNDLADARRALTAALSGLLTPQHKLAFEVLPLHSPPILRAWILDARPLLDLPQVANLRPLPPSPTQPDAALLTGDLPPHPLLTSGALTGHTLLWVAGDEVVASSLLRAPLTAGPFVLAFASSQGGSQAQAADAILRRVQSLRTAPTLALRLAFDPDATRAAEAHLACYKRQPPLSTCACVERRCQWADTQPLEACFEETRRGESTP